MLSYESKQKSETAATRAQINWPLSLALVQTSLPDKYCIFTGLYTYTNTLFATISTFIRFIYNQLTPDKCLASFPVVVRFILGRDSTVGIID
jgi:hypothetical protein